METSEWGPAAWLFLHAATFGQNKIICPAQQKRVTDFFELLGYMLPCARCRKHYNDYLEKHPVQAACRKDLTRWLVDLHNDVNVRTNNPFVQHMEYREVEQVYAYDRDDDPLLNGGPQVDSNRTAKSVIFAAVGCVIVAVVAIVIAFAVTSCRQGRCPVVKPS